MTLPKIEKAPTATELRDRVLTQMNGESRRLSSDDWARRQSLIEKLRIAKLVDR